MKGVMERRGETRRGDEKRHEKEEESWRDEGKQEEEMRRDMRRKGEVGETSGNERKDGQKRGQGTWIT